jgi:O-antigen chain-terminating methyltransferase
MRRTLERLAQERQNKEKELGRRLDEIRQKAQADRLAQNAAALEPILSRLRELLKREQENHPNRGLFRSGRTRVSEANAALAFREQVFLLLREQHNILLQSITFTRDLAASVEDVIRQLNALVDAKDKEWDALGSNHVGLIFKSLEWRVDKLAAESEDAALLMKKFMLLREKLERVLAALEEKKLPQPEEARALLEPLEDGRYTAFENRFRGRDEEVKKQLGEYVSCFRKDGMVVDLGCGRGEFLELLREAGIAAAGVDSNGLMVDICLDKGLRCRKGDILEYLAEWQDGSLGGIFSSQVIEHLPPHYLMRLVEFSRRKLSPGGTLVLETINPLSVFALVQVYFLDLSHRNPVHPQALKFMLEAAGFEDVEIKYSSPLEREKLQPLPGADEPTTILNRNIDSLNELLFGPAHYAAVARRK